MNFNKITKLWCLILLAPMVFITSCRDDDDAVVKPIASFQAVVDAEDFFKVNFINVSQNATSYSWDFGDGVGTSTEESPSYTYSAGGVYTVTLIASDDSGESSTKTEDVTITDPDAALTLLSGSVSKTWSLLREGTSMLLASGPDYASIYWEGSSNDGQRPCLYDDEFTFNRDGSFSYDDGGTFWAEYGVFNNVAGCDTNITAESCFDAIAANMLNACGDDVSAWLSGNHTYTYNVSTGTITLSGDGAWMGIPKLGTTGGVIAPENSVTFNAVVVDGGTSGVDSLFINFEYEAEFWPFTYVSYADPSLQPDLVTEYVEPTCNPLVAISPTEISHTFASNDASEWVLLQASESGSTLTLGVDDPTDATATKVGQYTRVAGVAYQELQFKLDPANAINFENLTTVSMEVYLPSSNDHTGDLTDNVFVGFGATECPPNWYEDQHEYQEMAIAKDTWVTVTFQLNAPDYVAVTGNGATVYDRNDLDMIYIAIGGAGHEVGGEFYMRNFVIE